MVIFKLVYLFLWVGDNLEIGHDRDGLESTHYCLDARVTSCFRVLSASARHQYHHLYYH